MSQKFLSQVEDLLPNIVAAVLILVGGFLVQRVVLKLMGRALSLKHVDATIHKFLMSMVRVVITVIVAVSALSAVKVPMSSIIAAIGTAGVAICLSLKDSLSNVAGGFIILLAKPFRVGDYVEIGKNEGTVDVISILYTRLNTIENKAVFIPNSIVTKSAVTNFTAEKKRCLELRFSISYSDDHNKAIQLVKDTLKKDKRILSSPAEPLVVVGEHGSSAIILLMRAWVSTDEYWQTRRDTLKSIKETFDENGITIPFDQLDVHRDKVCQGFARRERFGA